MEFASQAARYLTNTQSKTTGGWPINIARKFEKKTRTFLKTPWYSAMGQGHAISLLSRMFSYSKQDKYINSAAKALDLFEIDIKDGGDGQSG